MTTVLANYADARPSINHHIGFEAFATDAGLFKLVVGDVESTYAVQVTHNANAATISFIYNDNTISTGSSPFPLNTWNEVLVKLQDNATGTDLKVDIAGTTVLTVDVSDETIYDFSYDAGFFRIEGTSSGHQVRNVFLAPIMSFNSDVYMSRGLFAEKYFNVDYADLKNKPEVPPAQLQSDWAQSNVEALDFIKNKPAIPVAQIQSDWNQANPQALDYIRNKPAVGAGQMQSDYAQTDDTKLDFIKNKPQLAAVAYDGNYQSLINKPSKLTDFENDLSAGDPNFAEDVYAGPDKTPPYRVDNVISRENLYTWWGDNSVPSTTTTVEPFYNNGTFSRISAVGSASFGTGYLTSAWNAQYMIQMSGLTQDVNGSVSAPTNYILIKLPVKSGISHALFLKFIAYDRWSSSCVFVTNKAKTAFYRLQCQTPTYNSCPAVANPFIGPNGEPSSSHTYHEWQMFSIPQYILDSYAYNETQDNKSKYNTTLNICVCSGVNNGDGATLFCSGIAMRPNPYGLTFHGALPLAWATNGGNGSGYYSSSWNNTNLNQWSANTNYVNIRVPICPPKDPASSVFPDFYMVMNMWDWGSGAQCPVYLYNPTTGSSSYLGRWSANIKGRFGIRYQWTAFSPMGLIVPSPDPQYITYVGNRPYLTIRYDTTLFGNNSHSTGIFTEVVNQSGNANGYDPYNSLPLVQGTVYITTNQANLNLYNYFLSTFGIPTKTIRVVINPTVTIYSTSSSTPALDIGQFPVGTTIYIENQGKIQAEGGTAGVGGTVYGALPNTTGGATSGGKGGDAIKASYLNQVVSITNTSTGQIWAGGGGSGGGGKGTNGTNYYTINWAYGGTSTGPYWRLDIYGNNRLYWSGKINNSAPQGSSVTEYTFNGVIYVRGTTVRAVVNDEFGPYNYYYDIGEKNTTIATGGNGANGVRGRGYGYSGSLTGLTGSAGVNDAQTGGSSGNAGDWAQAGQAGTGTYPGQGGEAGFALVKGVANVTINNSGSILGQTSTTTSGSFTSLTTTFGSSVDNFNLYSFIAAAYGTPTGAFTLNFTIASSAVIKSTNPSTPAFDVGQFPSGSIITIINQGKIYGCQGAGGTGQTTSNAATAGGNGGTAIKASYSNQTVTITNASTGVIYGGGGGGGGGSKGANGVAGQNALGARTQYGTGYGWYIVTQRNWVITYVDPDTGVQSGEWRVSGYKTYAFWNGQYVMDTQGLYYQWTRLSTDMAGIYNQQGYQQSYGDDTAEYTDVYAIQRNNATWYGGSAGIGGAGGAGAKGRGASNQTASLSGIVGSSGTAGGVGENNAIGTTNGTAGQTGDTGGAGGDWGQPGSAGSGASGGAAGVYLQKGSATVTLTNNATADAIKGTLA
jgi:hypothetical protein